ncbi:hypothetical protein M0R45_015070 [Rubus argutus]|uniref:Uncharacterized protein n=1 Tax=Rubus argutus TaxID=59490 RepID=A0AAW1XQL5_RUBAR
MAVCSPLPPSQNHNEINIKFAMATHITTDHNSIPPKFTTFTLTASPFHNQIIHYHHKHPSMISHGRITILQSIPSQPKPAEPLPKSHLHPSSSLALSTAMAVRTQSLTSTSPCSFPKQSPLASLQLQLHRT